MQKPSVLWPPPSEEMSSKIQDSLRSRIRQMFHIEPYTHNLVATMTPDRQGAVDVGTTTSLPKSASSQVVSLVARTGETLTIDQQVHLYAQNNLLSHPLISPAMSYLGGLPPLLIIASDKEVLRDEIIYV